MPTPGRLSCLRIFLWWTIGGIIGVNRSWCPKAPDWILQIPSKLFSWDFRKKVALLYAPAIVEVWCLKYPKSKIGILLYPRGVQFLLIPILVDKPAKDIFMVKYWRDNQSKQIVMSQGSSLDLTDLVITFFLGFPKKSCALICNCYSGSLKPEIS